MLDVLENFRTQVNGNAHIQRIVKGWNTTVAIEESDGMGQYQLHISDGRIEEIRTEHGFYDEAGIKIIGDGAIMRGVFDGRLNGIRANNEGLIAIYGAMGDQVKLDAIALILWGI